jgi:aryl-alcohol dehydrogenase-like predicted oxidoreductase
MRLSSEASRSDANSEAVIRAALAAGVRLFDTADAYALDDTEVGHNERLLGRLLPADAMIVTKGGLTRPDGRWHPDGRAKHLAAAARASAERLGRAPDLYLLHAVDPKVPFVTSVRALAKLLADGVVRAIGLSNVTRTQLLEALAHAPIAAVEVEINPYKLDAVRGGLVALCAERGIQVLAHRPLGGPAGAKRIAKDKVLRAIADRVSNQRRADSAERDLAADFEVTTADVVLAWIASLGPNVVPVPGATRVETATSVGRAAALVLDDAALAELAAHFLDISGAPGTRDQDASSLTAGGDRPVTAAREVVMLVGMPAAGKSTYSMQLVEQGYVRLNRDERGGSLLDLARTVDRELAGGATKIVVDNTYATRGTRAPVITIAKKHGASIRCIVVATPLEQSQAHAAARILAKQLAAHGPTILCTPDALLGPGEILPSAQFRYRREYEPPALDEGFTTIDEVLAPPLVTGTRSGVIVELDDVIWVGRPRRPQDIVLRTGARDLLARHGEQPIGATTWLVGAASDEVLAHEARLAELLGVRIPIAACVHPAGPPVCWCRKPMPGLALVLAKRLDLDLSRSIHVGQGPADKGFAARAGMAFEVG